jgi:hypothetical protein
MEQWKRYMNVNPNICSYFVLNDPSKFSANETKYDYKIDKEYIYFNVPEIPIPGIFEKTVKAIQLFSANDEFWKKVEFINRTNLSSFYIWDRLLSYVEEIPKTNFVGGEINDGPFLRYVSGCGILMTRDMAELLISNISNQQKYMLDDDCMIGVIFNNNKIHLTPIVRFNMPDNYEEILPSFNEIVLNKIPHTTFHIRARCGTDDFRFKFGTKIYKKFVDLFYTS